MADLQAVEQLLNSEIRSDVRAAYEISGHTLSAGGKRLRPAAVLLSARAAMAEFPVKSVYASSAAVELIHMASLIHDDVVDSADQRRGRPTANAAFGNQISVLVGDYLLAKSIYLAAREGNMDVIRIFSRATVGLSEGEVLQITSRGDADTSEDVYYEIIRRKTAGFIAGCCEVGATLAEASPRVVEALTNFGMSLGIAFQIADDLLDFLADPAVTGKPRCSDLREGKMTLPLIAAYRELGRDRSATGADYGFGQRAARTVASRGRFRAGADRGKRRLQPTPAAARRSLCRRGAGRHRARATAIRIPRFAWRPQPDYALGRKM